jgi:hypothetical protein
MAPQLKKLSSYFLALFLKINYGLKLLPGVVPVAASRRALVRVMAEA